MDRFGLLGASLGHSFSPRIHELIGGYEYGLYERTESELENFFEREGLKGINVTIPYKKVIINYCSALSDAAKRIGSVNTVVKSDEGLKGFNTDYAGFRYMLSSNDISVEGKKVMVLGNGGAVRAVICALMDMGASEIVMMSRKAEGLSEVTEFDKAEGDTHECRIFQDSYENTGNHLDISVLVNTTPVGMFPQNGRTPAEQFGGSLKVFKSLEAVADIVYNPLKTELLLEAEDLGLKAANGLSMLVAQAVCASLLFTGKITNEKDAGEMHVDHIVKQLTFENSNIILIGMPGCGKSTYGRKLAAKYGRDFIDTDAEIVKLAGKSIPAIFEDDGEEKFRELETSVVRMACAQGGRVIATGGGVVTRERNHHPLKENGIVIFLDRKPDGLDTKGRPLSKSVGVMKLYEERLPLYRKVADMIVDVNGYPELNLEF